MKIELKRIYRGPVYTIGHLYVDGVFVCDTLEDKDRGLDYTMSLNQIMAKKVYKQTAIPTGTYKIRLDVRSPRFSEKTFYKEVCDGFLPRLDGVPGYSGVLIHVGNTPEDTAGCILVGYNKAKGRVINSKEAFTKLWNNYLKKAKEENRSIFLGVS